MTLLLALVTIPLSDPTVIALIGTVVGGIGLKVVEHWLGKNRVKIDDAAQMRTELYATVDRQKTEIKDLETDRDKWREAFYDLREQTIYMKVRLQMLGEDTNTLKPPPDL